MRLILKLLAGAVATGVAVWLVPGITLAPGERQQQAWTLLGVAAIVGAVNAVVKPLAQAAGFCLVVLTLGVFLLVINAGMLLLVSWLADGLGLGFHVDGFWPALFGSIVISVATSGVAALLGVED